MLSLLSPSLFVCLALPAGGGGSTAWTQVRPGEPAPVGRRSGTVTPNVLILLADDLGVDMVGAYAEGGDLPGTPNIDSLATSGVLFRNAYSHPVCSPTRASILTGRYPFRHGVGFVMSTTGLGLDTAELSLPEMLDQGTASAYSTSAFGKWHVTNYAQGQTTGPNLAGFGHFSGTMCSFFPPEDYSNWTHVTDGVSVAETAYAPEVITDEAIAWMNAQTQPFLCYLAFNLPHAPYHRPPDNLHSIDFTGVDPDPTVEPRPYYKAMVEALDTLVGRILTTVDPLVLANTVIIFLGDNGTPMPVTVAPFVPQHGKTTVFEGGINVPFLVSGPPVTTPGSESAAFVYVGDVFATVAEAAGVDYQGLAPSTIFDSISVYPYLLDPATPSLRSTVYSEIFYPNGEPPAAPLDFLAPNAPPSPRSGFSTRLQPNQKVVCQSNLGFGGLGQARLQICGPTLIEGFSATLTISGGPPNALGWLFEGDGFDPTPFGTGVLVPAGPYVNSSMIATDANGFYTQSIPFVTGLEFLYYQASFMALPMGFSVTNAIQTKMIFHGAAMRNDQYKLMFDAYDGEQSFYDLTADPFEQTNLLLGTLDPTQQQNYDSILAELTLLLNS